MGVNNLEITITDLLLWQWASNILKFAHAIRALRHLESNNIAAGSRVKYAIYLPVKSTDLS